jgi:hypothetical protein
MTGDIDNFDDSRRTRLRAERAMLVASMSRARVVSGDMYKQGAICSWLVEARNLNDARLKHCMTSVAYMSVDSMAVSLNE